MALSGWTLLLWARSWPIFLIGRRGLPRMQFLQAMLSCALLLQHLPLLCLLLCPPPRRRGRRPSTLIFPVEILMCRMLALLPLAVSRLVAVMQIASMGLGVRSGHGLGRRRLARLRPGVLPHLVALSMPIWRLHSTSKPTWRR